MSALMTQNDNVYPPMNTPRFPTSGLPSESQGTWGGGPVATAMRRNIRLDAAPAPATPADSRSNFLRSLATQRIQEEQGKNDYAARSAAWSSLTPEQKAKYLPKDGTATLSGNANGVQTFESSDNSEGIGRENFRNSAEGRAVTAAPSLRQKMLLATLGMTPTGDVAQTGPVDWHIPAAQIAANGKVDAAKETAKGKEQVADAKRPGFIDQAMKGFKLASDIGMKGMAFIDRLQTNAARRAQIEQDTRNKKSATQPYDANTNPGGKRPAKEPVTLPGLNPSDQKAFDLATSAYRTAHSNWDAKRRTAIDPDAYKEPEPTPPNPADKATWGAFGKLTGAPAGAHPAAAATQPNAAPGSTELQGTPATSTHPFTPAPPATAKAPPVMPAIPAAQIPPGMVDMPALKPGQLPTIPTASPASAPAAPSKGRSPASTPVAPARGRSPYATTATHPDGRKVGFNPDTQQWETIQP